MKNFSTTKSGFTIIEMMVSISLFLIVVMIGMDALLNANFAHQKSQDIASIIDNMTFTMEEMSRNIRTGYNYHCVNDGNFSVGVLNTAKSCASGGAIAFEEAHGNTANQNDQWVYKVESTDGGRTYNVSKSQDTGATWVQLNPSQVVLSSVSGFSVLGAETPSADKQQPLVTIRLVGTITYQNTTSPFNLQTSVSQRLLDR